ncbi:MAG: hypothetical protein LCI00_33695 [Chloroflexi bacterium]|nr:hypothetical protein [Chloroflexota bacterium]MCC6894022.1 hypothetical protein [Anaerolineae bacterium]
MMRKHFLLVPIITLLAAFSLTAVTAQPRPQLVMGEFVKGNISHEEYEAWYTFTGAAGDTVLIEVIPDSLTFNLDPTVELRNTNNETIALNDDFNFPVSLVVAKLPTEGNYTVVVSRAGGEVGDTAGDFSLRASIVQPVTSGAVINAEVNSDANAIPLRYVLNPAADQTIEITFSQSIGENYAGIRVFKWVSDASPDVLMNLDSTAQLSKAVLTVNLEADNFYIIQLAQTSYSFTDAMLFPVMLEIQ